MLDAEVRVGMIVEIDPVVAEDKTGSAEQLLARVLGRNYRDSDPHMWWVLGKGGDLELSVWCHNFKPAKPTDAALYVLGEP